MSLHFHMAYKIYTPDCYMHQFSCICQIATYFLDLPMCESVLVTQFYKSNPTSAKYTCM